MANWLQQTKEELLSGGGRVEEKGRAKSGRDSIISAGLTFEGKIKGDGNICIGGNFKGDVQVEGNVAIDAGADLSGEIVADDVTIAGNVEGNINASNQVKLLESCRLIGNLKASSLTVAAGSRMRGMVEFGWEERETKEEKIAELKRAVNDDAEAKSYE